MSRILIGRAGGAVVALAVVTLLLGGCGRAEPPESERPVLEPAAVAVEGEAVVLDEYGYTSNECLCSLARPQPEVPLEYAGAGAAVERAVALFAERDFDAALAGFRAIVEGGEARAEDYFNRGTAHLRVAALEEAIADLTRATELDPGLAAAHLNLGIAYYRSRDGETALEHVVEAIEQGPGYARAYWNQGHMLGMQGDYEPGLAAFDVAVRLGPDDPINLMGRGLAYANLGRVTAARADLAAALALTDDPALTVPIETALRDMPTGDSD
jgi:tetratricopeptide (TPR) repeat protein